LPFAICAGFNALTVASELLDLMAVQAETKLFWVRFQGGWVLPAVVAMTTFVAHYAGATRWLTRRNLALLGLACLAVAVLTWTSGSHSLLWSSSIVESSIVLRRTLLWWTFVALGYGLSVVNVVILVRLFLRAPLIRWPVALILAGQIVSRVLYLLDKNSLLRSGPLAILWVAFEYLLYASALFGFRLLDPLPMARQMAIAHLRDGLVVCDGRGRVVSLNPAAARMLATTAARAPSLRELLPELGNLAAHPAVAIPAAPLEISHGSDAHARRYQIDLSPLRDHRGLAIGCLLVLHDVTEQRRAEAQIREQQRALATLQERERLARELHDELGQVLGYVKLQAQAARDELVRERHAMADGYLAQLLTVVQEAHTDVREYILGARKASGGQIDLLAALAEYLKQYQANYGIQTELAVAPGLSVEAFEPLVQAQLLRIIQEALTNTRKHARARRVVVRLERRDAMARATIQDDGAGFDPARQDAEASGHYGLRFMQERAHEVGGSVAVRSSPGEGTVVVVEVPVSGEQ